ncbi:MAG: hypothetical protein PHU27_07725 [Salinivirgaceae bacterium]|nr:hypothetical protein [Salinivirgaceae bacterium]
MLGMGPFINEITNTNLVISTASAKILAEQLKSSPLEFWLPLITSLAAAFAATMSYWTSRKSVELSHNLFLNDLNKEHDYLLRAMFEEYTPKLPLSNKNKMSMCNFLEKLCHLYYDKVINKKEIYRYRSNLFHKDFVDYANKNEGLGTYKRWLSENK